MRWIALLLLVVVVIAAADARKKKKNKLLGKLGFRFGLGIPKVAKKVFKKYNAKVSQKHSIKHEVAVNYNVNIEHHYKHEVHCSKHCVPDKAYWHGDHCLCHAGLAGAGDLCCTDPKEYNHTCTIRGDPYVHSYEGQNAQVFNPCGQLVTVIHAQTSSHQTCKVTVRSADVIEQGIFITNQVEVSYEISGSEKAYVILDGYKYYNSLESSWKALGDTFNTCFSMYGEQVQILEDNHRRVWTLTACGTIINFRRDTRGGKPGVCVSSKYEYSQKPCDKPMDAVCNLLTVDTFPYHNKATYYLAKSLELKEYVNLRLSCAYSRVCRKVTDTFARCPIYRRAKAINTCVEVLEVKFRSCGFLHDGLDGIELFKMFSECLTAYCDGDQDWCYNQKESSVSYLGCKLPKMHCCDFKLTGDVQQQQQQEQKIS